MLQMIVGLIVGLILFLCAYLGYREGIRLGYNASKGIIPLSPIATVQTYYNGKLSKEELEQQKKENEDILAMLNYNGDTLRGDTIG